MQRAARWTVVAIAAVGLAAPAMGQETGRGTFINAEGKNVGTLTVEHMPSGTMFLLKLHDLPPGVHGMHIHSVGKCMPPTFDSAGPHFNPAGHQHGKENPKGPHAGDLDNITIPADGKLELQVDLPGVALRGAGGLLDEDGASIVIHANPDDYKTDPSGNSGARIACAPITLDEREE
ncbi:superoxide dismutase family protein [bacterium]|nr:superoxide dismutase family protein [bacterium]